MATLSGNVLDIFGDPAERLVRAYLRSTGALQGADVSDSVTGDFSITVPTSAAHFVIVFDGVATPGDDYNNNVSLLCHFDGSNGSTSFYDEKGHTLTANGNAQISTAQNKFGGSSLLLDGAGDYVSSASSSDWDLPGDFTIECFVRLVAMPTTDSWPASWNSFFAVCTHGVPGAGSGCGLMIGQTNILWNNNDASAASGAHGMSTGVWYHLAATRSSGTLRLFVDGAITGSATGITADYTYAQPLWIGAETGEGAYFNGYIDELRITKGVARYTSAFTPPAQKFTTLPEVGEPDSNALISDNIVPV